MAAENLLRLAIEIWRQGEPIPLDLAVAMIEEGLDLDALEEQYLDN